MTEPRYTPKVLMIVHDPWMQPNVRLHQVMRWHNPYHLAETYMADMARASHGQVRYQIVETIDAPWFPAKVDGFRYDAESYLTGWRSQRMHHPDALDYRRRIEQFQLVERYNRGDFDEVWVFSFPYAGEYESIMIGPTAVWCNAPALVMPELRGNMVMMGFNFERDVGCMLENFGHRVESLLAAHATRNPNLATWWQAFSAYDRQNPGQSGCGNVHFAPNSDHDYDWGNRRQVYASCDWWRQFPHGGERTARLVDCRDWGNGDMRAHHLWWLQHLPHHPAQVQGMWGDWWRYVMDVAQLD